MAYQSNIPQPTDQLSKSQSDILNNFQALAIAFNLNHVDLNAPTQGKHDFIEVPVKTPAPVTSAGEIGLYTKTSTFTSQPELVLLKQLGSTAPAASIEFSSAGYVVGNSTTPGWAIFPSGILIKWGRAVTSGAGVLNVTLNAAGQPAYSACYIAMATGNNVTQSIYFNGFTGTASVQFVSNVNAQPITFFVLGTTA